MSEEWTTVKGCRRSVCKNVRQRSTLNPNVEITELDDASKVISEIERAKEKLRETIYVDSVLRQELRKALSRPLSNGNNTILPVEDSGKALAECSIEGDTISERKVNTVFRIVSLGIGSLSAATQSAQSSRLQLAFLLLIADELSKGGEVQPSAPLMDCFEPLFNSSDRVICRHFGINTIQENNKGLLNEEETIAMMDSHPGLVLFYMPHCPHGLYCNVLWSMRRFLRRTIIIGNSFASYEINRLNALAPRETQSQGKKHKKKSTDSKTLKEMAANSPELVIRCSRHCTEHILFSSTTKCDFKEHSAHSDLLHALERSLSESSIHTFYGEEFLSLEWPSREVMVTATGADIEIF